MVQTPTPLDTSSPVAEVPMPPADLPYDDGEPLETPRHRQNINVLIDSLDLYLSQKRSDFYCGGNMFLYYSQAQVKDRDFRGPDFFAALDVEGKAERDRKYWAIWDENGRYPDVIVELMSDSTAKTDTTRKKQLYERTFRTRDYFVYHPYKPNSLEGWSLDPQLRYRALEPNDRGWLWCESLELWVGTHENLLRFFDRSSNLVLLPKEAEAQRAEAEAQRAEAEAQRAEAEAQRAEAEAQRADRTEAEIERLKELLRERGIDPNAS